MTSSLAAAHGLVVTMQCEYYAMEGLSVITDLIGRLRAAGASPGLDLDGILMTMYDSRTKLAQDVVAEVRRHFGPRVYDTVIPRSVRLSEAPSFGKPITAYDPHSRGAEAYRAFAREFAARQDGMKNAAAAPAAPRENP
jgi:chromosome partitioning protein